MTEKTARERVYLSEEERGLRAEELSERYGIHRSTAFRAKKADGISDNIIPGKIHLTEEEECTFQMRKEH